LVRAPIIFFRENFTLTSQLIVFPYSLQWDLESFKLELEGPFNVPFEKGPNWDDPALFEHFFSTGNFFPFPVLVPPPLLGYAFTPFPYSASPIPVAPFISPRFSLLIKPFLLFRSPFAPTDPYFSSNVPLTREFSLALSRTPLVPSLRTPPGFDFFSYPIFLIPFRVRFLPLKIVLLSQGEEGSSCIEFSSDRQILPLIAFRGVSFYGGVGAGLVERRP